MGLWKEARLRQVRIFWREEWKKAVKDLPFNSMLPKLNRLKKKKDFKKVFKSGKGVNLNFIVLKFNKNGLKNSRFGFIVSSKVSKKAVVRNKIKRRLRESVKRKIDDVKGGLDIVLITFPALKNKDFQEIDKIVEKLFKRAGILL